LKFNPVAIATCPAPLRILTFLLGLLLVWLPIAGPIYWLGGIYNAGAASTLALILLYVEFLGLLKIWGRLVNRQTKPLQACGLSWTVQNGMGLMQGLLLGVGGIFGLFTVEVILGWAIREPVSPFFHRVVLEGLAVGLGIGFAEELFFRGWLLNELERDYSPNQSCWLSTIIFSTAHFIQPLSKIVRSLPQLLGLMVLGMTLVWARQTSRLTIRTRNKEIVGQLGFPIGLHAGLVWGYYVVNVGNLIQYSNQVSELWTGIDQNPLAGGLGLLVLGLMAGVVKLMAQSPNMPIK